MEALLATELRGLEIDGAKETRGGVDFQCTLDAIYEDVETTASSS